MRRRAPSRSSSPGGRASPVGSSTARGARVRPPRRAAAQAADRETWRRTRSSRPEAPLDLRRDAGNVAASILRSPGTRRSTCCGGARFDACGRASPRVRPPPQPSESRPSPRRGAPRPPDGAAIRFLLAEVYGLSLAEVAEIEDVPLGTVKSDSNARRGAARLPSRPLGALPMNDDLEFEPGSGARHRGSPSRIRRPRDAVRRPRRGSTSRQAPGRALLRRIEAPPWDVRSPSRARHAVPRSHPRPLHGLRIVIGAPIHDPRPREPQALDHLSLSCLCTRLGQMYCGRCAGASPSSCCPCWLAVARSRRRTPVTGPLAILAAALVGRRAALPRRRHRRRAPRPRLTAPSAERVSASRSTRSPWRSDSSSLSAPRSTSTAVASRPLRPDGEHVTTLLPDRILVESTPRHGSGTRRDRGVHRAPERTHELRQARDHRGRRPRGAAQGRGLGQRSRAPTDARPDEGQGAWSKSMVRGDTDRRGTRRTGRADLPTSSSRRASSCWRSSIGPAGQRGVRDRPEDDLVGPVTYVFWPPSVGRGSARRCTQTEEARDSGPGSVRRARGVQRTIEPGSPWLVRRSRSC